jgi:hypothetical protein
MNIPTSILKSNYLSPEKTQQHQKQAKTYNKLISKYKTNKNKPEAQLKDEIITWFFSFDIITKLIISSVENKWLTNILHQLYLQQKSNYRMRFQYRFEEPLTDVIPNYLPQHIIINQMNNPDINTFFNYFQLKEDMKIRDERGIIDNVFLHKDINFYKTEDSNLSDNMSPSYRYSYYFALSSRMLQDESFFREMFEQFSGGQAFTNVVSCDYDAKNKSYVYGLPKWMDSKEFYSLAVFFIAFFEQTITMKYFLYRNLNNLQTELNSCYLTKLLNERKDLVEFVRKDYKLDTVKLCDSLNVKNTINEVYTDYRVRDIVQSRMKGYEMLHFNGVMYNNFVIYENDILMSNDIDKRLKLNTFKKEEDLVNALIFSNFENIFTTDEFVMKRIYESLVDLYANKNAFDLINGVYENDQKKKKKSKKRQKKAENTEATVQVNKCEEVLQVNISTSCFPFIKKGVRKETSDFTPGQFMGDLMMVRSNSNLEDEKLIKPFVVEIVNKILDSICHHIDNHESSEETTTTNEAKKFDDKDTTYSSAYLSDCKSNEVFPKKKKDRNKYKLYDVKAKKDVKKVELKQNINNIDLQVSTFKRDRLQSISITPSNMLTMNNNTSKSLTSTPSKTNTLTSFQININSKEFDIKKTFKKHDSFSCPVNDSYYFKNHYGMRYYYDLPMMNNFYYFNGHNSFNELFFFRFQKYILNYTEQVENNLNEMKEIKNNVITKVVSHIRNCLSIIL